MSEANKTVVRRLVEDHWNAKDPALVPELFASNVSLRTPDGSISGLEGAWALLQGYITAFPDFRITIQELLAEGDQVALHYAFSGTHSGPLGDIPASGRQVREVNGIAIMRISEGKIAGGQFIWDNYALRQQLGAVPVSATVAAAV